VTRSRVRDTLAMGAVLLFMAAGGLSCAPPDTAAPPERPAGSQCREGWLDVARNGICERMAELGGF
jgi:hypothetical protein